MSRMVKCFIDCNKELLVICVDSEISGDILENYHNRGYIVKRTDKTLGEFVDWYEKGGKSKMVWPYPETF